MGKIFKIAVKHEIEYSKKNLGISREEFFNLLIKIDRNNKLDFYINSNESSIELPTSLVLELEKEFKNNLLLNNINNQEKETLKDIFEIVNENLLYFINKEYIVFQDF